MAGLPRWIIKKYGVSKKAWSVFRGGSRKTKSRGGSVAKHKKGGWHKGGFGGKNILMKGLLGNKIPFGILGCVAAGYAYQKFGLTNYVPKVGIPMQSTIEAGAIGGLPAIIGSILAGSSTSGGQSSSVYL